MLLITWRMIRSKGEERKCNIVVTRRFTCQGEDLSHLDV